MPRQSSQLVQNGLTRVATNPGLSAHPSLWCCLAAYWAPCSGVQGYLKVLDFGPKRAHGTLNGTFAADSWIHSPVGNALKFDGTNDYLATTFQPAYTGLVPFSFLAWIKTTDANRGCIIGDYNSLTAGLNPLEITAAGKLRAYLSSGAGATKDYVTTGTSINTGAWFLVAVTYDGAQGLNIYTNGVLDAVTKTTDNTLTSAILGNSGPMRIGSDTRPASGIFFDGSIAMVAVYNRALRQSEILQHYRNASPLRRQVYTVGKVQAVTLSTDPAIVTWTVSTPALNQSTAPAAAVVTWTVSDPALNQSAAPAAAVVAWTVSNPGLTATITAPTAIVTWTVDNPSISAGGELLPLPAVVSWIVGIPVITLIPVVWDDCCDPCAVPTTSTHAGPTGTAGTAGAAGANGVDAYSTVASYIPLAQPVVPAYLSNVTITVGNSTWMQIGQIVFIAAIGYFEVQSKPSSTTVILKNVATSALYGINAAPGTSIPALAVICPGGFQGPGQVATRNLYSGSGSPEGVVTATVGSLYTDLVTANLHAKVTGTGDTGWL